MNSSPIVRDYYAVSEKLGDSYKLTFLGLVFLVLGVVGCLWWFVDAAIRAF